MYQGHVLYHNFEKVQAKLLKIRSGNKKGTSERYKTIPKSLFRGHGSLVSLAQREMAPTSAWRCAGVKNVGDFRWI